MNKGELMNGDWNKIFILTIAKSMQKKKKRKKPHWTTQSYFRLKLKLKIQDGDEKWWFDMQICLSVETY